MASPTSMDLSKFKPKGPKQKFTPKVAEKSNIRDYAAAFVRGLSGFAPGGVPGVAVGAIGEGVAQTIEDREDYNFPQIATQAALGAIPFGKAGGAFRGLLKGGTLSGVGNIATTLAEGEEVDPTNVAISVGLGALGGGLANKLDLSKFIKKGKVPEAAKVVDDIKTPVVEPVKAEVPKKKITRPEPNRPNVQLDLRKKANNPIILSKAGPSQGRAIMEEIKKQSAIAKSIPKVDLQEPVTVQTPKEKESTSKIISFMNIPKATAASTDLSAPLRQGIFLMGRKAWWNAWKPMIQSLREGNYNEINKSIASNPRYTEATKNGLMVTSLEGLQQREEAFASQIADKIPLVGKYLIKPSERAYVTFLNKLRMDLYSDLADKAERLKVPVDKYMLANYINAATGRGSMGLTVGGRSQTLESGAHLLNTIFFSPRFIASRVQLLNPVSYVKMDPFTRKEAVRDLATLATVASSVLGLAKLNGSQVTLDPKDSDFGKVRNGDIRVDILGGFGQYIRLFSQIANGLTTEEKGPDVQRFVEGKLSPAARMALDISTGEDYFGRETTIPKSVLNAFAPMITRDIYDLWKEDPNLVPLSGLSAFGLPVQSYNTRNRSGTPSGIPRVRIDMSKFKQKVK